MTPPRRAALIVAVLIAALAGVVGLSLRSPAEPTASAAPTASGAEIVQVPVTPASDLNEKTVVIDAFSYERGPSSLGNVSVTVRNVTSAPQQAWVWIILAPPDVAEAWRQPAYTAPEQRVALTAGSSETLSFEPPPTGALANGPYVISAWVHGLRGNSRFHSDGAGAPEPQYIGAPLLLEIEAVGRAELIDGSAAVEVTLAAENHSGAPVSALLTFTLIRLIDETTLDGGLPVYIHPGFRKTLADGESATTTLSGAVRLPAGRYRVIGWLRPQSGGELVRVVSNQEFSLK